MEFTDVIEWPNGEGFTPCTREFAEVSDAIEAILPQEFLARGETSNSLSPTDYEEYHRLIDKRDQLQLAGHLGKSVRYPLSRDTEPVSRSERMAIEGRFRDA